ncbi:pantetheinase-like [Dreissena polymorpha]|uniref:pantetheinase-like n=1 Tax=Dreissena polymorpha TaxID=45954 RepID=UPI002263EFC1|nr:pantetheinase-like [Dreissena polymorpha]
MLKHFVIVSLICALAPMVIGATFKAAVYEHAVHLPNISAVPMPRNQAVQAMMVNIRVYQETARIAASMGTQIIVFPEDGIYGMYLNSRELALPFMEYIPNATDHWNPCKQPNLYPNTDIQTALSCIARDNNMYVVANMGDKQPCNGTMDPKCPNTGYYQYNTDVAYDPSGTLVAKYHKYNLFFEYQFDTPKTPDISIFDTPFGRFGLFTCFDVLFEHPPIDLICRHNISNIAFPTAWMDVGPFFTSIQFHSSFALGLGVNFLGANIHLPSMRFHGSGIYTPQGAAGYYYNTSNDNGGQLIVREIPVVQHPNDAACFGDRKTVSEGLSLRPGTESQTPHLAANANEPEFTAVLFHDLHSLVKLHPGVGNASVCNNKLCCHVAYNIKETSSIVTHQKRKHASNDLHHPNYNNNNTHDVQVDNHTLPVLNSISAPEEFYALGAFDGLHTHDGNYYIQACTVIRCRRSKFNVTCTDHIDGLFKPNMRSFEISGNFSSSYLYPAVLLQGDSDFLLTDIPQSWTFSGESLRANNPLPHTLAVGAVFTCIHVIKQFSQDEEMSLTFLFNLYFIWELGKLPPPPDIYDFFIPFLYLLCMYSNFFTS